jgi:hypothetical protein
LAHVARYNFFYPASSMAIPVPADTLEAMRTKAQIVAVVRQSAEHVRRSLSSMSRSTTLYGRIVPTLAVMITDHAHERAPWSVDRVRTVEQRRAALVAINPDARAAVGRPPRSDERRPASQATT